MRCLSLTQPWASLVAAGVKTIETRSWSTLYRGPMAIHAAKGFPKSAKGFAHVPPVSVFFGMHYEYPRGAVIATCRLAACISTDRSWRPSDAEKLTDQERAFGDYSPGRYAWILEDVKPLPEPIPAKGALGLWKWQRDEDVVAIVQDRMDRAFRGEAVGPTSGITYGDFVKRKENA